MEDIDRVIQTWPKRSLVWTLSSLWNWVTSDTEGEFQAHGSSLWGSPLEGWAAAAFFKNNEQLRVTESFK